MVSWYNLIDLALFIFIIYATIYSYKNKTYAKIFDYFKIFLLVTVSAKLSLYTGIILQDLYITKSDTYTTLLLIGFGINILVIYHTYKFIFSFLNKLINSDKIRTYTAVLVSFLEVLIITTFSIYLVIQLYISKKYLYKHIYKSYSYKKIEKFYHSFLNDRFVNMVMGSDTGTNSKEVIFKSLKNSF